MGKRKRSSKRPQPQHKQGRKHSQFDKRQRLGISNALRQKTGRAIVPLVGPLASLIQSLSSLLDARMAFRLSIIAAGMMLADDRRVAAAWFAAAGVQDDWDRFYDCLISVGQRSKSLAGMVAISVLQKLAPSLKERLILAIDDTPTKRYGRQVEGAGVHRHPTPGPADGEWIYGHNWVSLAILIRRGLTGVIALSICSLLYVRAIDVPHLNAKYGWKFRTKHTLAVELVTWLVGVVRSLGFQSALWLVCDGAYASRKLLGPMSKLGVSVFSRLRRDAVLFDLPPASKPGQRGRPRIFGHNRIDLSKRAAHRQGWERITYQGRGGEMTHSCKTFLATSKLTGGVIRVVIVRFDDGSWTAYFCTNAQIEVRDILETVAARWALEEHFHDVKEIWGAGQQQVRNIWSNIGCWHLNQWMYSLVELCTWNVDPTRLNARQDRPWDNPHRRLSHADRRRSIAAEMLRKHFVRHLPDTPNAKKIHHLLGKIIRLCT